MAHPLTHLTHGIPTRRPFHPAKTAHHYQRSRDPKVRLESASIEERFFDSRLNFDQPPDFDEIVGRNPEQVHGSHCVAQHECEQQQSRACREVSLSGSCPSGRGFAPRFFQTPPRGSAFALR